MRRENLTNKSTFEMRRECIRFVYRRALMDAYVKLMDCREILTSIEFGIDVGSEILTEIAVKALDESRMRLRQAMEKQSIDYDDDERSETKETQR
ncbi:MAG: hypothetical protein Q4P30_04185 [Eubacteriales bacterium]|nr:hypothetical protein [Eubacteriales bacterium]